MRLKHRIDEVYSQFPFYGSRKIAAQHQRKVRDIHRKTVTRYMREVGIAAIYPGPNRIVLMTMLLALGQSVPLISDTPHDLRQGSWVLGSSQELA